MSKKINLKSSDGESFKVDEAVAFESCIIKGMIENPDLGDVESIPLPNVTSNILAKLIEYCEKQVDAVNSDDLREWNARFVRVDQATLFDLILAADYLNIKSLLDLTCQTVLADMIKEKTLEEKLDILGKVIEDCKKGCGDSYIPLPDVTIKILAKVIEYCKKHVDAANSEKKISKDDLRAWDADFVSVDRDTLFELVKAANYLEIKSLLDLTCQTVLADMTKGKTLEEKLDILGKVIEDCKKGCGDRYIPLPDVTIKILAKVIEYCKKHVDAANPEDKMAEDNLRAWDADFVRVDQATLFDLILAAYYLDIESLVDLTCQTVADMIKGKTPAEIRDTFNIKELTPEEEEEVRRENQWAFE